MLTALLFHFTFSVLVESHYWLARQKRLDVLGRADVLMEITIMTGLPRAL